LTSNSCANTQIMEDRSSLPTVYRRMQAWLALVCLAYLGLLLPHHYKGMLYDEHSAVFGSPVWLMWTGGVVLLSLLFFASVQPPHPRLRRYKVFVSIGCV